MTLKVFAARDRLNMFCLLALPQLLVAQATPAEKEVWGGELKYWDFQTAGKLDEYMSLWHDEFVGWPTGNARPGGRADIRKRIETELGQHAASTPGASIEARLRITHTWKRTPQGWKIIAGMSAE